MEVVQSHLLNPGATANELKELLIPHYDASGCIAVVGHEPDFSLIISELISTQDVSLDIKKASIIEVKVDRYFHGELRFMIPPKFLKFLSKVIR